jgi:hypothetical protein
MPVVTRGDIQRLPDLDIDIDAATLASATITTLTATTGTVTTLTSTTGNITNIDAGASGSAGTVDIFPSTASKGKLALTAADSAGDTTTTIVNASQAGARTYTIPDAGTNASFVMTQGAQTLAGALTLSSKLNLTDVGTVAAAGSAQGDATAITNMVTYVTASDGAKGVILPAVTAGAVYIVYDTVATSGLKIYPASGDDINDGSANAAITIEGKTMAIFVGLDTTTWAAMYTANS